MSEKDVRATKKCYDTANQSDHSGDCECLHYLQSGWLRQKRAPQCKTAKRKINDGTLCWRRQCLSGERVNKRPGSLWPLEILPTFTHNHNLEAQSPPPFPPQPFANETPRHLDSRDHH